MSGSAKSQFLQNEFFRLTLEGTVQRGRVYVPDLTEKQRACFQGSLRDRLNALVPSYSKPKSDREHEATICALADLLSNKHANILPDGRFRIGSAQKAVNLWLKYLWCSEEIPTPPHCPFDSRIIEHLPEPVRCNWTAIDDIECYRELVTAARQLAGERSLAEWELELYSRL